MSSLPSFSAFDNEKQSFSKNLHNCQPETILGHKKSFSHHKFHSFSAVLVFDVIFWVFFCGSIEMWRFFFAMQICVMVFWRWRARLTFNFIFSIDKSRHFTHSTDHLFYCLGLFTVLAKKDANFFVSAKKLLSNVYFTQSVSLWAWRRIKWRYCNFPVKSFLLQKIYCTIRYNPSFYVSFKLAKILRRNSKNFLFHQLLHEQNGTWINIKKIFLQNFQNFIEWKEAVSIKFLSHRDFSSFERSFDVKENIEKLLKENR